LHQQIRKLGAIFGKENVTQSVTNLGTTTTKAAKAAETARLQQLWDQENLVPLLNWKSFLPNLF
jgi:hypothetical protein